MELYVLLSAVALGLLALQCSSVHGSPAKHYDETIYTSEEDQYYQEPEDADDEEYETNNNMGDNTVNVWSLMTGRFVHTTGNGGLNSNGKDITDPSAQFVQTEISYNAISLSQNQQLMGISSQGQIVMDSRNSSDVAHEFEVVYMGQSGVVQLRVNIDGRYCYVGFTAEGHPLTNGCDVNSQGPETYFKLPTRHRYGWI